MKTIKSLTLAALATMAALAAALLFQTSTTQAHDQGQRGGHHDQRGHDDDQRCDNERADHNRVHDRRIDHQFVILLAGVYKPVALGHGPRHNLGLTTVDLNNGKWFKVKIYPVSGLPSHRDEDRAIGAFYVQLGGDEGVVAYDVPGGSFTARFIGADAEQLPAAPLPGESWTLDGTFKLEILETTGIYRSFAGGHIHMVDILKFRGGDSTFLENCFCTIHPKLVAP